jgi:hypothetical protein
MSRFMIGPGFVIPYVIIVFYIFPHRPGKNFRRIGIIGFD